MANPPYDDHLSVRQPQQLSLQSSLHSATRSLHAQLNKTIMSRFPLCLPPQAQDPFAYHLGMIVFGQIFEDYECAINKARATSDAEIEPRHKRIIEQQHTPSLARTESLQHDREVLHKRLCMHRHNSNDLAAIEGRLQTQAQKQNQHIAQHIREKPYLALAYTWTMYLALFNGGRHLYRALSRPGSDFWLEDDDTNSDIEPLSFWRFDAANEEDPDADQLKLTFKRNFDAASTLLTDTEANEVVQEAKSLFELCMRLIELLDQMMIEVDQKSKDESDLQPQLSQESGIATRLWHSLSTSVLRPAYDLVGWHWARPLQNEVKAAE